MIKERVVHKWKRKSRYQIRMMLYKHLLKYPFGSTISDLSKELKLSRKVIREELNIMYYENKLAIHQVGRSKLYLRKIYSRRLK